MQQLSTTITHQVLLHGRGDSNLALLYQQRALRSVNERLADPVLGIGEGVVGAVVSFLTFGVSLYSCSICELRRVVKDGMAEVMGFSACDMLIQVR